MTTKYKDRGQIVLSILNAVIAEERDKVLKSKSSTEHAVRIDTVKTLESLAETYSEIFTTKEVTANGLICYDLETRTVTPCEMAVLDQFNIERKCEEK